MSRDELPSIQSSRLASRRRYRRLAAPFLPACGAVSKDVPSSGSPAGGFELLAAELRIAELEKALLEAREAAFADPLTGALNRRGFERAYQREAARLRRSGHSLALVLIDLDDFKLLNDTHGHLVGDRALVQFVGMIQQSMRAADVICRFGGEEFVLLLPETTLENAELAVARFQSELAGGVIAGTDHVLTFSAGVVVKDPEESLEALLQRADAATYLAKRAGKNCVVAG